jgi:hypothetical protein
MVPLYERDLAEEFSNAIKYPLFVPNNVAEAGWPDRFVQLPQSRIVAVELKVVTLTRVNTFNLANFRQTQAAWMAKWQRNGGLGFLFVGINSKTEFVGYYAMTKAKWIDWLYVNKMTYNLNDVLWFRQQKNITFWFEDFIAVETTRQEA